MTHQKQNNQELDLDPCSKSGSDHTQKRQQDQQQQSKEANYISKEYKLKDDTVYKLVEHSVGAIALECGYTIAHQSSLDILTDVCCDYMNKIATLLKRTSDTEEWRDSESDFVDSLERVFHQLNIPSAANLHQFVCKIEAIKRHQLKQESQQQQQPQSQTSANPQMNDTAMRPINHK